MIYKRYNFTVFTTVIKKKNGIIKVSESLIEVYAQSIIQAKNRLQKMGLNAELKHN